MIINILTASLSAPTALKCFKPILEVQIQVYPGISKVLNQNFCLNLKIESFGLQSLISTNNIYFSKTIYYINDSYANLYNKI